MVTDLFVRYGIARSNPLPALAPGALYEYLMAANGTFVRAKRPGLEAQVQLGFLDEPVRGLAECNSSVEIFTRVPERIVKDICLAAWRALPYESLFYLIPDAPWRVSVPTQMMSTASVKPVDAFSREGKDALIELHSHNTMGAFFSRTDDQDEQSGFRIYTVIGRLDQRKVQMLTRVGIYGHFEPILSSWIYDLPEFVEDMVKDGEMLDEIDA